uniref:Uncharacterized protein n=1 Tax=Globisporangium ultimum (strain ATCC 200006 / CBS 805.95 / DAOM BR144) TaxID=431595 RepID=K3WA06_GLOUD
MSGVGDQMAVIAEETWEQEQRAPATVSAENGVSTMNDATDAVPTLTSALSPSRMQRMPTTTVPVRVPKTSPFKEKLRIDVSPPADPASIPMAMTSPLGIFATKKLPSSSHRSHPVAMFTSGENRSSPQLYGTPFLEYGMVIALSCDDRSGIVAAEGYASRDVRLEKLNYNLDSNVSPPKLGLGGQQERKMFESGGFRLLSCPYRDCLFEVVPKMTYDATIALETLEAEMNDLGNAGEEDGKIREQNNMQPQKQRAVADLKFKSEAELRLNATMSFNFGMSKVADSYRLTRLQFSCEELKA